MPDYTLREIPSDLHKAWKSSAALRGWSMKDYCYVALQRQIKADLTRKEECKGKDDEGSLETD